MFKHTFKNILAIQLEARIPEAVVQRCSVKNMFLEIQLEARIHGIIISIYLYSLSMYLFIYLFIYLFVDSFIYLVQASNFIKKETLVQVFSREFSKISKNTFFTEHLWWLLLMQQSGKTLTPADKTSNIYRLTKKEYNKMRTDTVTSTYKKQ